MGAVIILVIGGLLAAMLILPRQRELKRHQALMGRLAVGDHVMTGSGLYGTITELEGDLARLELTPGVVVKVARRAIASQVPPTADSADRADAADQADRLPGDQAGDHRSGGDVDGQAA